MSARLLAACAFTSAPAPAGAIMVMPHSERKRDNDRNSLPLHVYGTFCRVPPTR